ncbi:hypothetical protein PENTCL1PPCAC_15491, partial [Pristionchus entomophagus]
RNFFIIRLGLFVFHSIPPIWFILSPSPDTNHLLDSYVPDISWIRERGSYYFVELTSEVTSAIYGMMLVRLFQIRTVCSLFGHMFYTLYMESRKHSTVNIAVIRKSLIILLAQLIVPLAMIVAPSIVALVGILLPDNFSFEFVFLTKVIIELHPIAHNMLLLSLTAAYREFIISIACCRRTSGLLDILRVCSFHKY